MTYNMTVSPSYQATVTDLEYFTLNVFGVTETLRSALSLVLPGLKYHDHERVNVGDVFSTRVLN